MRPSYWSGAVDGGTADLLIVGAGLAGLSTALHCLEARPDSRVIVVERNVAGGGASGRNAGMVIPFPLIPLWLAPAALGGRGAGIEANRLLMTLLERTLDGWIGALAAPRPADIVVTAQSWFWRQGLKWAATRADAMGVAVERLRPDEIAGRYAALGTFGISYAGRSVQPWEACQRLRQAALDRGASLLEGVEVLAISAGSGGVEVLTDSGKLRAKQVLVATNAYGDGIAGVPRQGKAVHTYMLATAPLSDEQQAMLGGERAQVSHLDDGLYRRVHEGRLVFGALDRVGLPAGEASATNAKARAELRALLRRVLPQLGAVEIEREWGGAFCHRTGAPNIAASRSVPGLYFNSGYGGSGVALTLLSGALARGMLFEETDTPDAARLRAAYAATRIPLRGLPGLLRDVLAAN